MNSLIKRRLLALERTNHSGYHGVFVYYKKPNEDDALAMAELDQQGMEYLGINIVPIKPRN